MTLTVALCKFGGLSYWQSFVCCYIYAAVMFARCRQVSPLSLSLSSFLSLCAFLLFWSSSDCFAFFHIVGKLGIFDLECSPLQIHTNCLFPNKDNALTRP